VNPEELDQSRLASLREFATEQEAREAAGEASA
jgi:hypothetical protein